MSAAPPTAAPSLERCLAALRAERGIQLDAPGELWSQVDGRVIRCYLPERPRSAVRTGEIYVTYVLTFVVETGALEGVQQFRSRVRPDGGDDTVP